MECTCLRQTDVPGTSRLFADLIYNFEKVSDLYPHRPNSLASLCQASEFDFPDERRAALVRALRPLNGGNPSLDLLARPGTVAIITGQQVGLFSGPVYTIYKALTAIQMARKLSAQGIPAVPVFWLATEDHDFAEVNHAHVFGADHQPVTLRVGATGEIGQRPVGGIVPAGVPLGELRAALAGLPFAEETVALVERSYEPGETMGSAFARLMREIFKGFNLLLVDPMEPGLRELAAPLMRQAVERMPELTESLVARSKELVDRGYHAQVMVDKETSLAFLLEGGQRHALRRTGDTFSAGARKYSTAELAARAQELSPNALLRPVLQDYMLPTAAYVGGPAELAYFAQSEVLYGNLLGRQPVMSPRAGFTILDARAHNRMQRYRLAPTDLFAGEPTLRDTIGGRLVPPQLQHSLEQTRTAFGTALDALAGDLKKFDVSLAGALETSRRKIEYQAGKIVSKTARRILERDEQAVRDARSLSGFTYPEKHLQERFYCAIPFLAQFGLEIIDDLYSAVQIECPDHQFVTL
jgi:bacillithiol biosynthesis cysteine-adding enzyme BshC